MCYIVAVCYLGNYDATSCTKEKNIMDTVQACNTRY